jgi:hypothetical protein
MVPQIDDAHVEGSVIGDLVCSTDEKASIEHPGAHASWTKGRTIATQTAIGGLPRHHIKGPQLFISIKQEYKKSL